MIFKIVGAIFLSVIMVSCKKGLALRIGGQDIFALGAQDACHFNRNNMGIRVSWKEAMPLSLIIHKSVPPEWDSSIIGAAVRWNTAAGKNLVNIRRENSLDVSPGDDKTNVIFWMSTWDESSKQEQARTSTNWEISRLVDTDIKINAKNFRFFKTGTANGSGQVHLESLMVHEIGHALGLQHFDAPAGVMYAYLKADTERVVPSSAEMGDLACEY